MKEDYLEAYPILYGNHWWWRAREALVLDLPTRHPAPQGTSRLLDIGCGEGAEYSPDAIQRKHLFERPLLRYFNARFS